ncbi:pre-mRNA-processing factor 40 [Monoraphidium neglectum]|uniref:Pre-mRNA-processing factor 40 n=1 Tax=Monoraphidium neglectum TaxID=145388 RepID=A0A0D2LUV7_9CHLO|nr:pre-mRNA-processing factor 40 [Monoraphidium neglectum]KIY93411.1 pre-mRNA-processing factor 40 [Monoraphidium neglectum]|eukprot:XP_013892431.1 pre-mRNA-processing factor 40 [Monoraphidium neglectum]
MPRRRIINDPRYKAVRALGERKQLFNEYTQARRTEEKDLVRRRAAEAKDAFSAMLEGCGAIRLGDSFRDARQLLRDDPRWAAVPDEGAREELFDVFMRGFRRRTEEKDRARKREREAAYRELLRGAGLTLASQFRKVAAKLEGQAAFDALDREERLRIFELFVRELEERERQEQERAKEEERRAERRRRDAFRALLREHA